MSKKNKAKHLKASYLYEHDKNKEWIAYIIRIIHNTVVYKVIDELHITKRYKVRSAEFFNKHYTIELCHIAGVKEFLIEEE